MTEPREGLVVSGVGKVSVVPDMATVHFAASANSEHVGDAMERASAAAAKMVEALAAAGVEERDRHTHGLHLESWHEEEPRRPRCQASQRLVVRLRDIGSASEVIRRVVIAGGDSARVHGFTLGVDDIEPHRAAARELAMSDARRTAEHLASLAGRQLGRVRMVTAEHAGRPFARQDAMARLSAAEGPAVEAGELDVVATLRVTFDWGD